ncbi:NADH-cytochrome b5 reductase-like [Anthophora retusa]
MCTDNNNESSRPVTPSEEDCCHSGCNPCIFDVHEKLLEEYEKKRKQNVQMQKKKNILNLISYENFIVVKIEETSQCYILLSLKYQDNSSNNDRKIIVDQGQHVMLHLCGITKPFTPISFAADTIEFLIRLYPNGRFSKNLRNVKISDIIRIRGPYGNFKYEYNSFKTIVMFSMGSGITAVYPIAKSIIDNELEETKIHLIGGFQSILQIPLKKELQLLSDYWNFRCTLHISQLENEFSSIHGINIKSGRIDKESVCEILEDQMANTTLILICGTRQFNSSVEQWTRSMGYAHIHVFE